MKNDIVGQILMDIRVIPFEDSHNTYETIFLLFNKGIFRIDVDSNSDEIVVNLCNFVEAFETLEFPKWGSSINKNKIVAYWKGKNNLGYSDFFALGFNEFIPNFIITSIGSQLDVRFTFPCL